MESQARSNCRQPGLPRPVGYPVSADAAGTRVWPLKRMVQLIGDRRSGADGDVTPLACSLQVVCFQPHRNDHVWDAHSLNW